MPVTDFITELFCRVDDLLGPLPRYHGEKLHLSELVTIGMAYALKGGSTRAFHRWAVNELSPLFPHLPARTRLFRRLSKRWELATRLLADPTVFAILDTYGVETIHPRRDGRTAHQIGRKGISNHRWIVGAKVAVVVNQRGEIIAWSVMPNNVHDQTFLPLSQDFDGETICLGDLGFRCRAGIPENLVLCRRGTWPCRFVVETVLSMMTTVMHTKKMLQRSWDGMIARLSYTMAMFNVLIGWDGFEPDENGRTPLSIARFSL
jgi:Transposase DDE domain